MKYKSALFLSIYLFCFLFSVSNAEVRVVDGDTIHIGKIKYRLEGIDAPETRQNCLLKDKQWRCGKIATKSLKERIQDFSKLRCEGSKKDAYGRILAVCFLGNNDINAWMVKNGWALAYTKYSEKYLKEQQYAKKKRLGIWEGDFVSPWDWRKGERLASQKPNEKNRCKIKGNISSSGEKIFHSPGGAYYSRTKISEQKGEKWFCSEAEAKKLGWRKSKR